METNTYKILTLIFHIIQKDKIIMGKRLIELCKNCNLRILNGQTKGDSLGQPTFHKKYGSSTIDYVICNTKLMITIFLSHKNLVTF